MALDALVDSTQLDADLTSVANAIRTKGGTSAALAFPADFVSAIAAIPTGGGGDITYDEIMSGAYPSEYITVGNVAPAAHAFAYMRFKGIRWDWASSATCGSRAGVFANCPLLEYLVMPFFTGKFDYSTSWDLANGSTKLKTVDIAMIGIANRSFSGCTVLDTLILRNPSMVGLAHTNALQNTKFKSGGAGGTIYIPKALYDHLGDGGNMDYKAATNWSTYEGYGTITWAKIEGSYYETHYADGTTIS